MLRKRKETEMTFSKARIVTNPKKEIQHDIESDAELKVLLNESKIAIQENRVYSTDEILDAIERGEI